MGSLSGEQFIAASMRTPRVQFNEHQSTSISTSPWFEADLRKIEKAIGVGFFYYGPRVWMIGEVEPTKALQDPETRSEVMNRIITEYPSVVLPEGQVFYRIRKDPEKQDSFSEYDSPPVALAGSGRLDSAGFPVMYGFQDLQICVHECRVTAEDELYLATLAPTRNLRLLDLTELLSVEKVTEFESLDMAVHCCSLPDRTPTKLPERSHELPTPPDMMDLPIPPTSVFSAQGECHSRHLSESRIAKSHSLPIVKRRRLSQTLPCSVGRSNNAR